MTIFVNRHGYFAAKVGDVDISERTLEPGERAMSRSYEGPKGTVFQFNSDRAGGVQITTSMGNSVTVPAEDVLGFASELVREAKVAEVESACGLCLLGVPHVVCEGVVV